MSMHTGKTYIKYKRLVSVFPVANIHTDKVGSFGLTRKFVV